MLTCHGLDLLSGRPLRRGANELGNTNNIRCMSHVSVKLEEVDNDTAKSKMIKHNFRGG